MKMIAYRSENSNRGYEIGAIESSQGSSILKLEKSFHYHDALAAMGTADDFNELGMIEKKIGNFSLCGLNFHVQRK